MSDLSRVSGVSIPTIKFYRQEHLARFKLISVLSGIARLSLAEIR